MSPLIGPVIDPNRTESESLSDNCSKINGDISDEIGSGELVTEEELGTEDLEGHEWLMSAQWKHKESAVKQILKLLKCTILGKVARSIFLLKEI